ncbi:ATP binding, partial [Kappamyces sp. JEL0680]
IPLDDAELIRICTTDNEHRGNVYLRKFARQEPEAAPLQDISEGTAKSMQKLIQIFGVDPSPQSVGKTANKRNLVIDPSKNGSSKAAALFSPAQSPAVQALHKNKLNKFFGERPPDELIVDQLEQFFPGISTTTQEKDVTTQLKNIVQANLLNKRSSKRASSMMLRRLTQQPPSVQEPVKPSRPQALMVKKNDLVISTEMEDLIKASGMDEKESTPISAEKLVAEPLTYDTHPASEMPAIPDPASGAAAASGQEPRPISFRWVPGRLIGQGAFGKVFHALNLDSGDFMAVKQVITGQDNSQQKKSNDSLLREIELLSELDHDNIVRYFGIAAVLTICGR